MKKFNLIKTDLGQVKGVGLFKTKEEYILIDTNETEMLNFLTKLQKNKEKLSLLEFSGLESDVIFTGSFLIETIHKNSISGNFEINIKRI